MLETPIETLIKEQITLGGPISIAQLMAEALGHPVHGYYSAKEPFGQAGDFITAPEISQLFGEMIGIWVAYGWQQMGCMRDVALIEMGPGRGTLMKDVLRATQHIPGFHQSISVHMVETSQRLAVQQGQTLTGCHPRIAWHRDIEEVPSKPFLLIANELFDALPIHQYVYTARGWHERMVGIHPETGKLHFTLAPSYSSPARVRPDEGAVVETSPASEVIIQQVAERMAACRGVAIMIDYGYDDAMEMRSTDTLQAVRHHQYHPVLEMLGEADLTAHVNFTALKEKARSSGALAYGAVTQGDFLRAMGIELRAAKLAEKGTAAQQKAIWEAASRLTAPDKMGELFKVIAITDSLHPLPAGF